MHSQDVKDAFVSVYKKLNGHIGQACAITNIGRSTYYEWIRDDKNFKQQIDDVNEGFLDSAEACIRHHIEEDNINAAQFLLRTIGKRRGYTTQTEVQNLNQSQPTIQIVLNAPEGQKTIDIPAVPVQPRLPDEEKE